MKNYKSLIALTLLALAFAGCSKKESIANLGVIELTQNEPKHFKVDGIDWTITENRFASGKQTIIAEAAEIKVTKKDILNAIVPADTKVGATWKERMDLSSMRSGVEIIGSFGGKLARYTLRYDAN